MKGAQDDTTALIKEFQAVLDFLKRNSAEKSDEWNSLRFIVLCKFIATLRPIKNLKWQDSINSHLSQTMLDYVTAILREDKNENIEYFSKVLL